MEERRFLLYRSWTLAASTLWIMDLYLDTGYPTFDYLNQFLLAMHTQMIGSP